MADILSQLQQEAPLLNPWMYREKTPERVAADKRSAAILERLSKESPGALAYQKLPVEIAKQVHAYESNPEQWTSGYEERTGDYPLYHAAQWAQSLPSAIYATGKMLGNEVDRAVYKTMTGDDSKVDPYPEAYDQYRHSANTLTGNAFDANGPSYWRDVVDTRMAQERAPQVSLYPSHVLDSRIADEQQAKAQEIEAGSKFLERSKAPPYVSNTLGPAMDAFMSWPSSLGSLSRVPAYQSAKWGVGPAVTALRGLTEVAPDVLLANPDLAIKAWDKYRKGELPWGE